jgi:hypothetical protein
MQIFDGYIPHAQKFDIGKAITHNLPGIDDNSILSAQLSDTIRDVQSEDTYYVCIPAATNNALNKYNYGTVMKAEVP